MKVFSSWDQDSLQLSTLDYWSSLLCVNLHQQCNFSLLTLGVPEA